MALNPRIPSWQDQRVWVIGASYGIGAALARRLINGGARVAMSARSRDLLDAIAEGNDALVEVLDVTDAASVAKAARRILAAWGGVDLVLIVAGTHVEMRADTFDLARAKRLFDVNVIRRAELPRRRAADAARSSAAAAWRSCLPWPAIAACRAH